MNHDVVFLIVIFYVQADSYKFLSLESSLQLLPTFLQEDDLLFVLKLS